MCDDSLLNAPLDGLRVLVSRPAAQADKLVKQLQDNQANVISIPAIQITAAEPTASLQQLSSNLADYDMAIFISRNAVEYALNLPGVLPWPDGVKIAAIGASTAHYLRQQGLTVAIQPDQFDSENLLAMPELAEKTICQKKILIFRGGQGREHLRDVLKSRHAVVDYADVYQRVPPDDLAKKLNQALEQLQIDVITVTSNNALQNLINATQQQNKTSLLRLPLVVPSERCKQFAESASFKHIFLADNATDNAIVNCLYNGLDAIRSVGK